MGAVKAWIEAMRLRTLPVSVAGVIAGCGYALKAGSFKALPAILCMAVAVLAQIASNFANEYYDFKNGLDKPGREGPRRGVTEGDITPRAMMMATYLTLGAACCCGLGLAAMSGWWLIGVGVAVALGVVAYSAGPWPLSHHGLGEVAVILFFGLVPVNFTAWLQTGVFSHACLLGSLSIGLFGANVLIVNNYRDAEDDEAVGKHTLAVIAGRAWMPILYALNAIVAVVLMWSQWPSPVIPGLFLLLSITVAVAMTRMQGRKLTPLLGITAMLMLIYSLGFLLIAM